MQIQHHSKALTFDKFFKQVFGSPGSEEVLADMLNAVLGSELKTPILSIRFLPQEYVSAAPEEGRICRLDIAAADQIGRIYNVEMQRYSDKNYQMRLVVYVSYLIATYTKAGDGVACRKVITLSFGEGPLVKSDDKWADQLITKARFMLEESHVPLEGESQPVIVHVNMKLARKLIEDKPIENFDLLEKWVYYIATEGKMATHEELVNKVHAVVNSDPGVLRAHERFLEALKTDDLAKRLGALQYLNSEMKYAGELATARVDGEERGKLEGKIEGKRETAKEMKLDGVPIGNISRYTGLSEHEIATL